MGTNINIEGAVFVGGGLNDLASGGAWSSLSNANALFIVKISATGTPDHFEWSLNGAAYSAPVAITGTAQVLSNGVAVTFAATTGHTSGDLWIFLVSANSQIQAAGDFRQRGYGAFSRNLQDKLRDTVSVKDFGAKGDGVTDDTSAIQQANLFASLFTTSQFQTSGGWGARVFFPRGKYMISQTVNIPYGVVWEGESAQATVIGPTVSFAANQWTSSFGGVFQAPLSSTSFLITVGLPGGVPENLPTSFNSGITNFLLDCGTTLGNISGIGVLGAQENTIVSKIVVNNFTDYGMLIGPFSNVANISDIRGFWFIPRQSSTAHRPIVVMSTGSRVHISDVSIVGPPNDSKSVFPALDILGCSSLKVSDLHLESYRSGAHVASCVGISIDSVYGDPSITSCVDIDLPRQTAAWSSGVTYPLDQRISYNGIDYYSLQAANTGHQPNTSPTWWIAIGNTPFVAWSSIINFNAFDVCTSGGQQWIATQASLNQTPGIGSSYWTQWFEAQGVQIKSVVGSGAGYCLRDWRQSSFDPSAPSYAGGTSYVNLDHAFYATNNFYYTSIAGAFGSPQSGNQPDISPLDWIPGVPIYNLLDSYFDVSVQSRQFSFKNRTAFGFDSNRGFPYAPVSVIDVMMSMASLAGGGRAIDTGQRFRRVNSSDPYTGLQFESNVGGQSDLYFGMENGDLVIYQSNLSVPQRLVRFPWAGGIVLPGQVDAAAFFLSGVQILSSGVPLPTTLGGTGLNEANFPALASAVAGNIVGFNGTVVTSGGTKTVVNGIIQP